MKIRTVSFYVFIHNGDVAQPVVLNSKGFEIREKDKIIFIKEGTSNSCVAIKNNDEVVRISNSIFQRCSSSNIKVGNIAINAKQIGSISINNTTGEKLEIFISKSHGALRLYAKTTSVDITIEDLTMSNLLLESTSGDIILSDVDLLNGNLKSVSGDIKILFKGKRKCPKSVIFRLLIK